eukprot:scaffold9862_cov118-Isochrysis_galbana.AAC.6
MATRQLRLEPTEVISTADKGAKRVRVDSTEESSSQSSDSRHGMRVQQRPLRESQHPPSYTITASAVHYNTLLGIPNFI